QPSLPTLFPYTTLFRSQFPAQMFALWGALLAVAGGAVFLWVLAAGGAPRAWQAWHVNFMFWTGLAQALVVFAATQKLAKGHWSRSEEHTSELQSRENIV